MSKRSQDIMKHQVRVRDGQRCTRCRRTNQEHEEEFGRPLEVHLERPGLARQAENCVSRCRRCLPQPSRPGLEPLRKELNPNRRRIQTQDVYRIRLVSDQQYFYLTRNGADFRLFITDRYVTDVGWDEGAPVRPAHVIFRRGPFPTMEQAEDSFREWFVEHPLGTLAEVFALPQMEGFVGRARGCVKGMTGGDQVAALALRDLLEEAGVGAHDVMRLSDALAFELGLPPFQEHADEHAGGESQVA
jgi:hypothetical protein